ncbi:unnamed protein product, partial [Amoebophrya sp. A25]
LFLPEEDASRLLLKTCRNGDRDAWFCAHIELARYRLGSALVRLLDTDPLFPDVSGGANERRAGGFQPLWDFFRDDYFTTLQLFRRGAYSPCPGGL